MSEAPGRSPAAAATLGVLGAAAAAHWVPSVVSLGQWLPVRTLPSGLCTWRGRPALRRVAVTFDDGPDPAATPAVLEALDALGVRATFFWLGEQVERHPALAREVVARGHDVGTHGHRHRHHLLAGPWTPGRDLDRALAVTEGVTGRPVRWFRPPYGQCSGATLAAARRRGLRTVLWSAWAREWAAPGRSTADRAVAAAAEVTRGLRPGAVVLLHDSEASSPPGSAAVGLAALQALAAAADGAALELCGLDELLGAMPVGSAPVGSGRR
ncbi:MAG TPA: polysaccharide deacetylase family protein [Acidimicrobiales bacterium]|nr:polysaccharide deacetylase family protein [Acidimicrobiales bacterium]